MVVIKSDQLSPTLWWLGRIIGVFLGTDGIVCVARVLTVQDEITRPVAQLVLLPMA